MPTRSQSAKKTPTKNEPQITSEDVAKYLTPTSCKLDWAAMAEEADQEDPSNDLIVKCIKPPFADVNDARSSRRKAIPIKRLNVEPRFTRSKEIKDSEPQASSDRKENLRQPICKNKSLQSKIEDEDECNRTAKKNLPSLLEIKIEESEINEASSRLYVSPKLDIQSAIDMDKTPIKQEDNDATGFLRRSPRKRTQAQANISTPSSLFNSHNDPMSPVSRPSYSRASSIQPDLKKKKTSLNHTPKNDNWVTPKCGWVDENSELGRKKILQRQKDLDKAYDSDVYKRYSREVARKDRAKGVHPFTPNKFINYPRRSWDTMVRNWRREIHIFMNESYSNCASLNTSFCASSSGSEKAESPGPNIFSPRKTPEIQKATIPKRVRNLNDPNDLASLLGHYDIDSRAGDDSTLKAPMKCTKSPIKGPVDFSTLKR